MRKRDRDAGFDVRRMQQGVPGRGGAEAPLPIPMAPLQPQEKGMSVGLWVSQISPF